jgi:hypothetical protein
VEVKASRPKAADRADDGTLSATKADSAGW